MNDDVNNTSNTEEVDDWVVVEVPDVVSPTGKSDDWELVEHEDLGFDTDPTKKSIEGVSPGDIVFFKHTDSSFTHSLIRKTNQIAGLCGKEDDSYIHAEVCIGIDKDGKAIIAGATGGDLLMVRATTLEEKLTSGGAEGYRVASPKDKDYARAVSITAREIHQRGVSYSKAGCPLTAIPDVFKPKTTLQSKSMFCSEFIVNSLQGARSYAQDKTQMELFKKFAQFKTFVSSLVSPGKLSESLRTNEHFTVQDHTCEQAKQNTAAASSTDPAPGTEKKEVVAHDCEEETKSSPRMK